MTRDRSARDVFLLEVARHEMSVLRDDGLYRHVRFKAPGTMMWHFDLVTWPGHLVITGDLEDFHFARVPDMFEFFRSPTGQINPGCWSEKLCGPTRYKSWSPKMFKQIVFEQFWEMRDTRPGRQAPLWREICHEVLRFADVEHEAREALADFSYLCLPAVEPARDFVPQRIPLAAAGALFEFTDSWEWDFHDYDWQFLISLHAIVWGINQYDAAHPPVAVREPQQVVTAAASGGGV